MERVNLSGWEYDDIERTATDLFEDLGLTKFPPNCFEIAAKLKIELKKYSELSEEKREMMVSDYEDGYTTNTGKCKYTIYYNDKMDENRIRFTLWYEIGHIQLGHFDNCKKPQARMKAEANHFAVFVQAPMPAVIMYEPFGKYDVKETFNVSLQCASNIYSNYIKLTNYPGLMERIKKHRILDVLDFSKILKGGAYEDCV